MVRSSSSSCSSSSPSAAVPSTCAGRLKLHKTGCDSDLDNKVTEQDTDRNTALSHLGQRPSELASVPEQLLPAHLASNSEIQIPTTKLFNHGGDRSRSPSCSTSRLHCVRDMELLPVAASGYEKETDAGTGDVEVANGKNGTSNAKGSRVQGEGERRQTGDRENESGEDDDDGDEEEKEEGEKDTVQEVVLAQGQIQPLFSQLPVRDSNSVQTQVLPCADDCGIPPLRTGYVFDYRMTAHAPLPGTLDAHDHPESYMRLVSMYTRLMDEGILDQCLHIESKEVERELVLKVHTEEYCKWVEKVEALSHRDLLGLNQLLARDSVYMNNKSGMCARLAAGSTVELCRAVVTGKVQNGFAIVRPPGHHAEHNKAMGFCVFNNVAIAVRDLQQQFGLKKILIVDWDVHHGNGIQNTFESDASVMYISIHRYEDATFYPESEAAAGDFIGVDDGRGFNINIAWPCAGMGDVEYLHAFHRLVMPVAYEFQPEMVIVAAGFDAAEGDPIGGCHVSPSGFATMAHLLKGLANGNLVLALEGGYDITAICDSVSACTKVLLGESPPTPRLSRPVRPEAAKAVQETILALSGYWSVLSPMGGRLKQPTKSYDRTFNLADVMRRHRVDYLFAEYGMICIPLSERSRLAVFDKDVLCTYNFLTADTVFLSVHGIWPIRIEFDENSEIDMHASFGADPMHSILDTIKERGHGLMDVCVSQKETRDTKILKRELLEFIWDFYIIPSRCKRIVIICAGSACADMVKLLSRKPVEDNVLCVVMVPGDAEEIPKISTGKAQWYFDHSFVAAPTNHDRGSQRVENKREGRIVDPDRPNATIDDRTQDMLQRIHSFIADRIKPPPESCSYTMTDPIPPSPMTPPIASFHSFNFDDLPYPLRDLRRCSSTSLSSNLSTPMDVHLHTSLN